MRATYFTSALVGGLSGLVAAHSSHDGLAETQEPFIGWTQEDLDAKWGTDVSLSTRVAMLAN